ncbi:hypothetical protein [Marininema halotolerans]|uniref:Uncharacterized protein n=1 Tax=Marininema halotolerans TaxID=1155944 RepID=A0A1I6UUV3_9BACL|nr:hypothetical protein [Marininema halotolerans]SFT05183.1 hypothetical protein SAMN05444972_1224 [Marininema halotolerans]
MAEIRFLSRNRTNTFRLVVIYRTPEGNLILQTQEIPPLKARVMAIPESSTTISITVARVVVQASQDKALFNIESQTLLATAGTVNIVAAPKRIIVDKPLLRA